MVTEIKRNNFKSFFEARNTMLEELLSENHIEYAINNEPNSFGHVDENFRAVIKLKNADDLPKIKKQIKELEDLWTKAKGKKTRRSSMIIPQIIEPKIHRMQIYVNQAYSSTNHTNGYIPIGGIPSRICINQPKIAKENLYHHLNVLKEAGYLKDEPYDESYIDSYTVYIDTECALKKEQCDSIQKRVNTGKQIRVALFFLDEEGETIKKTQSMGILIVPNNQCVSIYKPNPRKTRNDSLQKNDEDLIDLPLGDTTSIYKLAKLYRKYD